MKSGSKVGGMERRTKERKDGGQMEKRQKEKGWKEGNPGRKKRRTRRVERKDEQGKARKVKEKAQTFLMVPHYDHPC